MMASSRFIRSKGGQQKTEALASVPVSAGGLERLVAYAKITPSSKAGRA